MSQGFSGKTSVVNLVVEVNSSLLALEGHLVLKDSRECRGNHYGPDDDNFEHVSL